MGVVCTVFKARRASVNRFSKPAPPAHESKATRRKPTTFGRALTVLFLHEDWVRVHIKMNLTGDRTRNLKGEWSDHYTTEAPIYILYITLLYIFTLHYNGYFYYKNLKSFKWVLAYDSPRFSVML